MKSLKPGSGVGDLHSQQWEPLKVSEQGCDTMMSSRLNFEEAENIDCGEKGAGRRRV